MNKIIIAILLVIIVILTYFQFMPKNEVINDQNSLINNIQNLTKDKEVKLYTEKDNNGEMITGAMGDQMKLIAYTTIPATITYTIKYKSAAVVPNPKISEISDTKTISVNKGKTVLKIFNAIDGKSDINFSYIDNTNKPATEINPDIKNDTTLRLDGVIKNFDEFNNNIRHYDLIANSKTNTAVTYTLKYTDNNTEQVITKTVAVPIGKTTISSLTINSLDEPVLTYSVK